MAENKQATNAPEVPAQPVQPISSEQADFTGGNPVEAVMSAVKSPPGTAVAPPTASSPPSPSDTQGSDTQG